MMFFRPVGTGKIAGGLYAVKAGMVNFFVYRDGEDIICIDSGLGKGSVTGELNRLDIDPAGVTHVFLTHSDYDHAGGIGLFEKAMIYLSVDEEQMITRKKARQLGLIYNPGIRRAYTLLNDDDVVTAGSIKVRAIATPGHTPGSMSYLVNGTVLFTGDTLILRDNKIHPFKSYINMDTESQKKSIRKLAHLDNIVMVCTAHTGYTEDFQGAIDRWK